MDMQQQRKDTEDSKEKPRVGRKAYGAVRASITGSGSPKEAGQVSFPEMVTLRFSHSHSLFHKHNSFWFIETTVFNPLVNSIP